VTRIEADATLGAPPPAVWELLIDHERWPEWFRRPADGPADGPAPPDGLRLEAVALVAGAPDRVGTERDCRATLPPLPLPSVRSLWPAGPRPPRPGPDGGGGRLLRWTDRIADVHAPWMMELDVAGARPPLRRARLRLILVEGAPGQTRMRLRLTYAPGAYWPLDALWLRRRLAAGLRCALDGLHARYPVIPAPAPAVAQSPAPAPSGHVRAAA
jgi:hypothetical protein